MNPDHKMTEEQERLSQRGLSFHENDDRLITKPPRLDGDDDEDEDGAKRGDGDGQLLLPP